MGAFSEIEKVPTRIHAINSLLRPFYYSGLFWALWALWAFFRYARATQVEKATADGFKIVIES